MGWEQALELQTDLWRWWGSQDGHDYGQHFHATEVRHGRGGSLDKDLPLMQRSTLLLAEPFWVSDELTDVIAAAEPGFRPEPLLETDLLTRNGFVLFPRPWVLTDIHGDHPTWRAAAWMPAMEQGLDGTPTGRRGISLFLYTHRDDFVHEQNRLGETVGTTRLWEDLPTLIYFHGTPWWFGETLSEALGGAEGQETEAFKTTWRTMQVFFRISMQYVSTRETQQPSRATRRRAKREHADLDRPVTVIRLRRPRSEPKGERSVDWKSRWIVHGHWRNQWFPASQAHRQIWISPYVKGPEDKPLRVPPKRAFELVR